MLEEFILDSTEALAQKESLHTDLVEQISTLEKEKENLKDLLISEEEYKKIYFENLSNLEEEIQSGKSDAKIAYLTFDDGPYLKSQQFLDVLDKYNVPATFFYLMKDASMGYADVEDDYDKIYSRIINSGHTLGNHTASHKLKSEDSVYQSVDYFMSDIEKNRKFIQDRYGYTTDVMRFPGGSTTSSKAPEIKKRLKEIGYCYVD